MAYFIFLFCMLFLVVTSGTSITQAASENPQSTTITHMKKVMLFFLSIILLSLLAACTSETPVHQPLSDEDRIATIVASTLSAFPTSTSIPTIAATVQPTSIQTASQAPVLRLDDFQNKVLLGENEHYSVYLINSNNKDGSEKTGEIVVHDKGKNLSHPITGVFTFFATTIVSNDSKGEYILLSSGSYILRTAIVISLNDKKQATNDFCSVGHLFWNDYVIFNNCDTFRNRPWGAGQAPSIEAINLKTGLVTDIEKSDLMHQFIIMSITNNNLQYREISVEREEDWKYPDNQITVLRDYNLLSLVIND